MRRLIRFTQIDGTALFPIDFGEPGLQARVAQMDGVEETRAQIRGSGGQFEVRFGAGTELKMRELELQRVAADLVRDQPRNTFVSVGAQDLSFMSRFVMVVQVTGGADRNSLRDLVDERIEPRIAADQGDPICAAGPVREQDRALKEDRWCDGIVSRR